MRSRTLVLITLLSAGVGSGVGLFWYRYLRAPQSEIRTAPHPGPNSALEMKPVNSRTPLYCRSLETVICGLQGPTKDASGFVQSETQGELQALRILKEIARAHPDWTPAQRDEALAERIYTPSRRKKVINAFAWVKLHLRNWIQEFPKEVLSEKEKSMLADRIQSVRMDLPPPASLYKNAPELLTQTDVLFVRQPNGKMRLRLGGAFILTVRSWFNLVFTLSHELAHSIDPCELRQAQIMVPAFQKLQTCFTQIGLVPETPEREECEKNDHLAETFADWVAVEMTSRALEGFAKEFDEKQIRRATFNAVRDLCDPDIDSDIVDSTFHPTPKIRIEKIFGNHPRIRNLLGCSDLPAFQRAVEYCRLR